MKLFEIGTDKDPVRFLVPLVPVYSVKKIVQMIKSLTAREVFRRCAHGAHVKKMLWGGEFWSDGYFASTVGKYGDEAMIGIMCRTKAALTKRLHSDHQLALL